MLARIGGAGDVQRSLGAESVGGRAGCLGPTRRYCRENGEEVKVSGFGNFQLKDKPARPGRNPRTGEDVEITARRVVTFKSGQKLKEKVKSIDK